MGCFGCTPVCPGCNGCGSGPYDQPPHRRFAHLKQDAPEIMRLEADNARLRAALLKITELRYVEEVGEPFDEALDIADAALKDTAPTSPALLAPANPLLSPRSGD